MSEPVPLPVRDGEGGGGPPRPLVVEAPWWRLVTTLAVSGALAGFLIVVVHQWTEPRILAHRARVLREAIEEVLHAPERFDTLFVVDGALVAEPPEEADLRTVEQIYPGYDASGRLVGYAIPAEEPGFQDLVRLIFGYDPGTKRILGMKVMENLETPGLGSRIATDSAFNAEFRGAEPPLVGVKAGRGTTPHDIDMITGATISSRTVIRAINEALERLGPMIEAYLAGGGGGADGGRGS